MTFDVTEDNGLEAGGADGAPFPKIPMTNGKT